MNCRHLSPRGWRHHLPRQRGHWVCDLGRGVVKPCGPLCNESCDQYQEPGTTGPQEDTTMPGQRIKWDAPARETVKDAAPGLTLEKWAKWSFETGQLSQVALAAMIGCSHSVLSSHLKLVPSQLPPGGSVTQPPAAPAPVASRSLPQVPLPEAEPAPAATGEPLEDDGDADLTEETPAVAQASPAVDAEFRLEPVVTVDCLLAFLRDEGLSREAELFCRGWNARGREVA